MNRKSSERRLNIRADTNIARQYAHILLLRDQVTDAEATRSKMQLNPVPLSILEPELHSPRQKRKQS
jgi:hypothetical protein